MKVSIMQQYTSSTPDANQFPIYPFPSILRLAEKENKAILLHGKASLWIVITGFNTAFKIRQTLNVYAMLLVKPERAPYWPISSSIVRILSLSCLK
jgi:hypothetical protein